MNNNAPYLDLDARLDEAWAKRHTASTELSELILLKIKKLVLDQFPDAGQVVLYEDHSHDHPHAHIAYIVSREGDLLVKGTTDAWHEADYSHEIDELVWDLYHVYPALFKSQPAELQKIDIDLGPKALVMVIDL